MAAKFDVDEDSLFTEINITPLTDVALVLLIIFMITSSAMLDNGLQVKLPSSKSSSVNQAQNAKPIYITISKDGQISVNDGRVEYSELGSVLKSTLSSSPDKTVIIRGDESIVLGRAVEIMDLAKAAGADKIAIATRPPK